MFSQKYPTFMELNFGKWLFIYFTSSEYVSIESLKFNLCTCESVSIRYMFSGVTPANRYATASVYLFPRPPANGFTLSGNISLMLFIMLAFTFPAFLKIYFFIAWKNYSGSIRTGPSMFTCLLIYFLEKVYIGKDLIVIHTTL